MNFMDKPYTSDAPAFVYAAPSFGRKEAKKKRSKFSLDDLSEQEFDAVMTGYGVMVEDVLPLTDGQKWFFSNDCIVSSNFCIQALFKVNGLILPQKFNDHIGALTRKYDILRTAFLRGSRTLRVVLKIRTAEIRFHDLSNLPDPEINRSLESIMAASRRRGFDLEKDRLLRIGVFKTAPREYAVLLAQPQIVADGWDFGLTFATMFEDEETEENVARKLKPKNFSFGKYLEKRGKQDKAPAIQYWKKLLEKLKQASQLPGYKVSDVPYQQAVCSMLVDRTLTGEMQAMAKNNAGFIALLQTAWGIMLQQYNTSNDAVYGVILSNRSAKLDNIEDVAGIINVMPIRVTCPIDTMLEDLGKKQQMQLVLSQPYSYCTLKEFQEISGLKEPLFNHFLNFHSFGMEACYTDIKVPFGVTPIGVDSFDWQSADLGIYFRIVGAALNIEFVYHRACFTKKQIELLQQGLLAVLRQIVQRPQMQVCEVKMPSIEQIHAAAVDAETVKRQMIEFLKDVSIFANLPEPVIWELVNTARSEYFVEGDVIFSEGAKQEKFYIVYTGNVELSRSATNGWSRPLKVLKRGSVLGYDGIFDQRPSVVRAEALLGDVTMIAIPNKNLCKVIYKNYGLAVNIIMELNEQVNRFQKLWIST